MDILTYEWRGIKKNESCYNEEHCCLKCWEEFYDNIDWPYIIRKWDILEVDCDADYYWNIIEETVSMYDKRMKYKWETIYPIKINEYQGIEWDYNWDEISCCWCWEEYWYRNGT